MYNLDIKTLDLISVIDMTVDGLFDLVDDRGLEQAVELYVKHELYHRLTESRSYFGISRNAIPSAVDIMFEANKDLYLAEAKAAFLIEFATESKG